MRGSASSPGGPKGRPAVGEREMKPLLARARTAATVFLHSHKAAQSAHFFLVKI